MKRESMRGLGAVGGAALAFGLLFAAGDAKALTAKECHAKFNDAKAAGTLNGLTYKAFHAANCGTDTSAAPAATPATAAAPAAAVTAAPAAPAAPAARPSGKAAATPPVDTGPMVFPTAVSPKYASESAGTARMHTCLDQYHANKASGGNGGHKWIEKGDGYYSECSKHLKG